MLRVLTETALLFADLGLDEVTDIQLAIDEIATSMIAEARPDSWVACDLALSSGRIEVSVTALVDQPEILDERDFGWHVVRAVTESLEANVGPFDRVLGGHPAAVEFGRSLRGADR
jgi:serine/threonine-protein kinase RsbW